MRRLTPAAGIAGNVKMCLQTRDSSERNTVISLHGYLSVLGARDAGGILHKGGGDAASLKHPTR